MSSPNESPDLNKKGSIKKPSRRAISFSNIFGGGKKQEEFSQLQEENKILK